MNANDHDRRLEEVAAYALGALDPEQVVELERHLAACSRCQEELQWLSPAVRALPETVEPRTPPSALKRRLMAEARADVAAEAGRARGEERRQRAETRPGLGEWLGGLNVGGLTWKPLAGLALVIIVIAGGIGYAVGNGGGSGGGPEASVSTFRSGRAPGVLAEVRREGSTGRLQLENVPPLADGRVLEAWVQRDGTVEPVKGLFAPDHRGEATTTIADLGGVDLVMVTVEPAGGTRAPTSAPIASVRID
ncbi:MAG: anti-sigma factor [Actinobacteria bacterium]|nr:anti-sigma factor [Actinomycetota bacterium]